MSSRSWRKIVVGAVLFVLTAWGIVFYRSQSPEWLRRQVVQEVGTVWSGSVIIERPRYSSFGPLQLETICFDDPEGHRWIRAEGVELIPEGWPILGSRIQEIHVRDLDGSLMFDPNSPLPLKGDFLSGPATNTRCRIRVDHCRIVLRDTKGSQASYADLTWQLDPIGDGLRLLMIQNSLDSADFAYIDARIDPLKNRFSGRIDLGHSIRSEDIQLVRPYYPILSTVTAEGIVRTELEFSGTGPDFDDIRFNGVLSISEGRIIDESGFAVVDHLQASAQCRDNWISIDSVSGEMGGGTVSANLMGDWSRSGIEGVTGQLTAERVHLSRSGDWILRRIPLAEGRADLEYVFFRVASEDPVQGYGRFRLTDANVMQFPVIPDLYLPLGLPAIEPMTLSDGRLDFTHSGPTIRIDQGRIFNSVAAVIAEPGGTIRLDNGDLDLYVVGVGVQAVEDALSRIPVIRTFNRAANTLVRLHVLGNWSDPSDRLIRKEPVDNLQQSAKGLLEDLARGGADLTDRIQRAAKSLLREWTEDKPGPGGNSPVPR